MFQRIKDHPLAVTSGFVIIVAITVFLLTRTPAPRIMTAEDIKAQARQEIIESGRQIHGTVVGLMDTTITVRTQIADIEALANSTNAKNPPQLLDRDVVVTLDPETTYIGLTKDKIVPGTVVKVILGTSIYETEHPTAQSVELADLKTRVMKEVTTLDMIAATVAEVQGRTLVVEASVVDEEKLQSLDVSNGSLTVPYTAKRYTVTVTPSTEFLEGKKLEDIRFGSMLNIWGEGNLYVTDAFVATKIYIAP